MERKIRALVTGAASGIGRGIVEYLCLKGDYVFACDIDEHGLDYFRGTPGVTVMNMDVTRQGDIDAAVAKMRSEGVKLDALVNNAGVGFGGPLAELPVEVLYRQFEVNVFGIFRVTKAFFPLLLENRGRIVLLGSASGFFTAPFVGPYSMSKHSLEAYADALRRELDPLGMKVVIIDPGSVRTPIWDKVERMVTETGPDFSPAFRERAVRIVRMGIGRAQRGGLAPIEIAKTVFHVLHSDRPKARYSVNRHPFVAYLSAHLPDAVVDAVFRRL